MPDTMPLLRIDGDALEAILTTLVENARQAGATLLTITPAADLATVRFDLADDGPGIPAGDRDRIFDPFFTSKRELGGTGLGLSIARSLLQAYGGSIELSPSELGAHFTISVDRV
jgi:signal transduction histidine kinase